LSAPKPLRLDTIPDIIFSEVMRDADLVVSVARVSDEVLWSEESYQRRAELLEAILGEIGLPGVKCDGRFARIEGKLGRYRVHLGSAAVHIEPGNYLCIIPNRVFRDPPSLFLPFADVDLKTAEVISKIMLLSNDDKIKDKTILEQIHSQGS
jgi:hypothetical protein